MPRFVTISLKTAARLGTRWRSLPWRIYREPGDVEHVDVVVFPGELETFGHLIETDKVVFVKGKADQKRERPNILTDELIPLDDVREKLAARVAVRLEAREVTQERIVEIRHLCEHQ